MREEPSYGGRVSRSLAPLAAVATMISLALVDVARGQAGGGSSGFGGGGGGGGGGFSDGGSSGSGSGSSEGDPIVVAVVFGVIGLVVLWILLMSWRYNRKVRKREQTVHRASAEAADDDAYFASDALEEEAEKVFRDAQKAWDDRDRERLAKLIGKDLLVEWNRRLDDFDSKGWHNRVEVLDEPEIQYVGITNREDDDEDRAVVRIKATLRSYVVDELGHKIMRSGQKTDRMSLCEYWTLARRDGGWYLASIEQRAEGDHHLDEEIVPSPWSDGRIRDEALTEVAAQDALPDGFTTADLADFDFEGDARQHALDLSLADARFGPDVLEAAARRAVAAWAEAVDGEDAALEQVASPAAIGELLYAGDRSRRTRVVVRGPRVKRIRIAQVKVDTEPATMTVDVELGGRRYVEDRDTAAVLAGDKNSAQTFTERWTLALDGPGNAPWRLVDAGGVAAR